MTTLIPAQDIRALAAQDQLIRRSNFVSDKTYRYNTSYGLSSYGYDVRLGSTFKSLVDDGIVIDPEKGFDRVRYAVHAGTNGVILPGRGGFILAHTVEHFTIPEDVVGFVANKSTLARLGIHVAMGILEPGWRGQITLEISNLSPCSVKLTPGMGICQVMFWKNAPSELSYFGRYQDQLGVTEALPWSETT